MRHFFSRLFNLYPGEEKNALIFSLLAYLWAFAITSGQQFSDALFLIHVGADSLPLAYGLTAAGMLVLAFALLHSIHRLGSYRSFAALVLIGIVFYTFTGMCVWLGFVTDAPWFWFVLKSSAYLFYAFGLTSYWTFVDEYHDVRDAKRMYTLFLSMIFLGYTTTGVLMRSAFLSLDTLFVLILFLFSGTGLFIRWIQRHVPLFIHEETEQETARSGKTFALPSLIRAILSSRITLLLLTGNILMQLMIVLTEFNYLSVFDQTFSALETGPIEVGEGTEALLTQFLGQMYASVGIFQLVIGFFLYSRLVRRFGLGALLPLSPIFMILIYSGWFVSSSLFIAILGFFVVEGWINVIDDNNFNLLLNATPSKLKNKIRVVIESFFEPIGMLTSAALLTFFEKQSKGIALFLSILWLMVVLTTRTKYLNGIFENLKKNTILFSRSVRDWLYASPLKERLHAMTLLMERVKHGTLDEKLLAFESLLSLKDEAVLPTLLPCAEAFSLDEKKRVIPLLEKSSFAAHVHVQQLFQNWLKEGEDEELCGMIQFLLAEQGLLSPGQILSGPKSHHYLSQAATLASMKKAAAHLPTDALAETRNKALMGLQRFLSSENDKEICIGLRLVEINASANDVDLLIPFLRHESLAVARLAAEKIFAIIDKTCRRQANILIERLHDVTDSIVRLYCLRALAKLGDSVIAKEMILQSAHFRPNERRMVEKLVVGMGLKTVPMLLTVTKDTSLNDRCRLLAGRILGRLALPQLRANLKAIFNEEIDRAYFYFHHAHTLPGQYPDIDLSKLVDAMNTGYESVIDFIIQLLTVAGEVEDEELISRSLRSKNPKMRSQAIEALEKTCDPSLFSKIEPLVEDIPVEEKLKGSRQRMKKTWTLSEVLDKLDDSPAQVDQIIASTFKFRLNLPGWRESLRKKMSSQEEIFHHFAYELLEE